MTINAGMLAELRELCSGATVLTEGQVTFVYLPQLAIPSGSATLFIDALLCPEPHSGYDTRLFLERPVSNRGNSWTTHQILGRTWHTWSWRGVSSNQRLAQILAGHLVALR